MGGKERGIIVRRIAGQEDVGPDGEPRSVSRNTLDRWVVARHRVGIAERTLREQCQRRGLTRAELLRDPHVFGRYEAREPNERWIADVGRCIGDCRPGYCHDGGTP